MGSVPLVAMQWQPQDPMEQYSKMQALLQQQRLSQQNQQLNALAIEKQRMEMAQVKAMNDAFTAGYTPSGAPQSGGVPLATPPLTGASASPMAAPGATGATASPMAAPPQGTQATGSFNRENIYRSLAAAGQAGMIPGLQKSFADADKLSADVQKTKDEHTAAAEEYFSALAKGVQSQNYAPEAMGVALAHAAASGYPQEAVQIQQELAQNPQQLKPFIDAMVARSPKQAQAAKDFAQAGQATAEVGKITADTAKTQAEMPGGGLYSPSDNQLYSLATSPQTAMTQQGQQAAAVLARKQREKLQQQAQEAGVRIAAENSPAAIAGAVAKKQALDAATGAGVQVYATDHSGRTMLMTKGDAVAQGFGYSKVGTAQISEDRQLNNRLSDVQQKIAQYEQSFRTPLDSHGWFSSSDMSLIAQVIGTDKLKLGAFGAELPVDFINKLGRSGLYQKMSPQAQQRVISYFNAREAIQGYQRVLTGSGRSSEKAMELNLDTLPAPIDPENYAGNALKAFKQNLAIAGQGLPILPGVKTPEEIEQQANSR
jgi:hypothetical protein